MQVYFIQYIKLHQYQYNKPQNIEEQNAKISVNGISKEISIYSGEYFGDVYVYKENHKHIIILKTLDII